MIRIHEVHTFAGFFSEFPACFLPNQSDPRTVRGTQRVPHRCLSKPRRPSWKSSPSMTPELVTGFDEDFQTNRATSNQSATSKVSPTLLREELNQAPPPESLDDTGIRGQSRCDNSLSSELFGVVSDQGSRSTRHPSSCPTDMGYLRSPPPSQRSSLEPYLSIVAPTLHTVRRAHQRVIVSTHLTVPVLRAAN